MPYTPPEGAAVDFLTGYTEFPRAYNNLLFRYPAGAYTAPAGGSITANFPSWGVDWIAPLGTAADFQSLDAQPTTRRLRSSTAGRWQSSAASTVALDSPSPPTRVVAGGKKAVWFAGAVANAGNSAGWGTISRLGSGRSVAWGAYGLQRNAVHRYSWSITARRDAGRAAKWGTFGELFRVMFGGSWHGARPADVSKTGGWAGHLIPTLRRVRTELSAGDACNFSVIGGGIDSAILQDGVYLPPNGGNVLFQFGNTAYQIPRMVGSADPRYTPPHGRAVKFIHAGVFELVLDGSNNPVLDKATRDPGQVYVWGAGKRRDVTDYAPWTRFSRPMNPGWGIPSPGNVVGPEPGQQIIIPVKRAYIVVNEIHLSRVADNTPIVAESLSISFDCDSWLPAFSANIPEGYRDAVMPSPDPVELFAFINGSEFRFLVEKVTRNREFGKKSVTISGRSIACELSAPYAAAGQYTNTIDRTAQQLIDDALVNTGYAQAWNVTDWLVPADNFSLYGTPADVANRVAESIGAVLSAGWYDRELRMSARYPVLPWDWASATPEYVIPSAVTQTEAIEWLEKPDYNLVYVSGVRDGVLGQVKRAGTAGDKPAQMVADPLITHTDAARQRGTAILANTGRRAMMQISLPVLPTTGVIDICRFVEFSDGANTRRGIVRANQVSVAFPQVRQTLTIEASA